MRVVVTGGGAIGRHLSFDLAQRGHEVTLVEQNKATVDTLREEMPEVKVLLGDACEPWVLEDAELSAADVVVAATGDDEDNIVVANLAKFEFEVPRVVARVKNALNTWLYEPDIGVDVVVSAPHTIAEMIEEQVVVGDVVQLLRLPEGQGAIVETTVPEHSQLVGRSVAETVWPPGCVAVALVRSSQIVPALTATRLDAGDRLICLTDVAQAEALHHLVAQPAATD
jgi:trk system potassium uptake protein